MPTVRVLQQVVGTDSGGSGATAVVTATFVAGSYAHFFVTCDRGATINTPTSTPSQVWTLLDALDDVANSQRSATYVSDALVGGSTTITETFSAAVTNRCAIVKEIGDTSGYDSAAAAHNAQQQTTPTTGADLVSSLATPTLTRQPALLSGFSINTGAGANITVGAGFTDDGASAVIVARGESKRVTSTTGAAATYTATSNTTHQTFVAAFLESSGIPTPTVTQPPANIRHSEGGKRRNWDKTGWFNTRAAKNDWFWRGWPVTTTSGVTGTLAKTNANDTSAAAGTTTIVGALAKTNNNDTSAASGATTILGTLAKTNANDTSAASGTTTVTGTVAKTNNNDSVVASGSVGAAVSGTLATTNANDTLAASGTTTVLGTLARTNANDTSAASGTTTVTGTVATTNANDSVVASGQAGAITGTVSYTNNDDGVSANGIVGIPNTIPIGGAGHPSGVYWGVRKHKKFTKNLEWLMDTVVSEYYEEMAEKANPAIQKEAAKIIRPFAQDGLKIPELVNWDAMQQDLDRVIQLLELYQNYRNIEEEDELWMMMH